MSRVAKCAAVFCALLSMGAAAPPADLAALFASHPGYSAAALSPDGKKLALVSPNDTGDKLAIFEIGSTAPPVVATLNDTEVNGVIWVRNDRVVVSVSRRTLGDAIQVFAITYRALALDADGGNITNLMSNVELQRGSGSTSEIVDLNPSDPNYVFMSTFNPSYWSGFGYNLYRVNLAGGAATRARAGTLDTAQWIMDGSGNLAARIDSERGKGDRIFIPAGNGYREITRINDRPDNLGQIVGLTEDGRSLAVISRRAQKRKGLYRMDLATGNWGEALYTNPDGDVYGVVQDEGTRRVIGVFYVDGGLAKWVYLSADRNAVLARLQRAFPGKNIWFVSWNADKTSALFEVFGDFGPVTLYHIDTRTNRVSSVASKYAQWAQLPSAKLEEVVHLGKDGSTLRGLLALPPGREPQGLPLIVMPGASAGGVHWIRDYLSQKGYAALHPGRREHKDLGELSGKGEIDAWMSGFQEDIGSDIAYLVENGVVDPKRVCVMGQGLDGYVALSTGALSANAISCTISIHGYPELKPVIEYSKYQRFGAYLFGSDLVRNSGNYSAEDLERASPTSHADAYSGPVLLIDGEERGWNSQSEHMETFLRRANKPVTYVEIEDEWGDLGTVAKRKRVLDEIDRFLATSIGR